MLEKCVACGKPISDYPCKFCGYVPKIKYECPRLNGAICSITKKACGKRGDYLNCDTLYGE